MTNCARDADAARDDSGLITRCGQSKCRALVMATRQADETTAVPAVRSDEFPPLLLATRDREGQRRIEKLDGVGKTLFRNPRPTPYPPRTKPRGADSPDDPTSPNFPNYRDTTLRHH